MSGIRTFMFIVAVPALIALVHDAYLFYEYYQFDFDKAGRSLEEKGYMSLFAALGFIWTRYEPESYRWVVQNVDKDSWALINEILTYKAFFVFAGFAAAVYAVLGVLRVLGLWPFSGAWQEAGFPGSSGSSRFERMRARKEGGTSYKYKRR